MNEARFLRGEIKDQLQNICIQVNSALRGGEGLSDLKPTLKRLGRGEKLPHWYGQLYWEGTLPNLDGKSLGSVLEMIFVAVLENHFFRESSLVPFRVNPAKGVDIPDLSLGVKSPSENYCTSEPFFSSYERIIGNEYDAVILLTDYQTKKKNPPLQIQIIKHAYLTGDQIADKGVCLTAKKFRERLLNHNETKLKKIIRFVAYVNKSDYEAKQLWKLLDSYDFEEDSKVDNLISEIEDRFYDFNRDACFDKQLDAAVIERINRIKTTSPRLEGLVAAIDDWVIESQKDFGRYPNDNEWNRFVNSTLDGKITMSLALQWRYNFRSVFAELF